MISYIYCLQSENRKEEKRREGRRVVRKVKRRVKKEKPEDKLIRRKVYFLKNKLISFKSYDFDRFAEIRLSFK